MAAKANQADAVALGYPWVRTAADMRRDAEIERHLDRTEVRTAWGSSRREDPDVWRRLADARYEGRTEQARSSLLTFLRARGLRPDDGQREKISRCRDLQRLLDWTERAAEARSIADVLR